MGQGKNRCSLGTYQYLNFVEDDGERRQFVYADFPVTPQVKRLMNRAARTVEGVIGVIIVDNTDGVSFAILIDETVTDVAATLMQFNRALRRQLQEAPRPETPLFEPPPSIVPDDLRNAMVVHSSSRATDRSSD